MTGGRLAGPALVLVAAAAGLSWASVFGLLPLLIPVSAAVLPVLLADQLALAVPRTAVIRPLLAIAGGAAAGAAALVLLGPADLAAVTDGAVHGWQRMLDSTLPARPDAEVVAFVPALALLAAVLGVEWIRRGAAPLLTLLPSFVVLVLGQAVHTADGRDAPLTAAGYGLAAAAVLAAGRRGVRTRTGARRPVALPLVLPLALVAGLAAWGATTAAVATGRPGWSVQDGHVVDTQTAGTSDPLGEIGDRLAHPDAVAFTARADVPVDRWPLVVLDRFDGVNWGTDAGFRVLGSALVPPALAVPVAPAGGDISGLALDGPFLPVQERLISVDGTRALIDPATGVLLRSGTAPTAYHLTWDDVRVDREKLTGSAIDPAPVGAVELTEIPAGIADVARKEVGPGVGPSVSGALLLEKQMRKDYTVATGTDIPTGHSYAQLLHFLTTSKRGTSEQFATAYAVMARSLGIPTRVVVGFRDAGGGVVHNGDVLAWPEIAVSGLGWVPLDPTGGARTGGAAGGGLAAATQQAREELPTSAQVAAQDAATPVPVAPQAEAGWAPPWWAWLIVVAVLLLVVPAVKVTRRAVRHRGGPRASVLGAWADVRDALADQGTALPDGATVRDIGAVRQGEVDDVEVLARCVDRTCWSGAPPDAAAADAAWDAARRLRRAWQRGSWRARRRAAFGTAGLRGRRQLFVHTAPRTP